MEVGSTSEASVSIYQVTRRNILEGSYVHRRTRLWRKAVWLKPQTALTDLPLLLLQRRTLERNAHRSSKKPCFVSCGNEDVTCVVLGHGAMWTCSWTPTVRRPYCLWLPSDDVMMSSAQRHDSEQYRHTHIFFHILSPLFSFIIFLYFSWFIFLSVSLYSFPLLLGFLIF